MVCNTPQELLAEIQKYMILNNIQKKDLAARMKKIPQSISQIFDNGNPTLATLFQMCEALNLKIDFTFIESKSDTE